jgi:hypothetical protein
MKVDREHILAEIRRTAAANRGVPLGARRFADETGIPERAWLGRHWARWGDALRDAGFEANTLQGSFEEDGLLERYAELIREIGHIPVRSELEMKHHRDPTFPVWQTFARRLGSNRSVAVPRVVDYCERQGGASGRFADVLAICHAWKPPQPRTSQLDSASASNQAIQGYVYLLRSGKHYKIGRSNAVGRRERELAIQLPQKGAVLHKIATDDPAGIEAYWHRRFESRRGNGEWFNLTADDVAAFRRRKYM